ncbi:hypothetical protein DEU51_1037 [Pseudomonas jessenii]|jgi:hypothetical protein|uniref:Uncharacterized protein n=1 Tax=Pseudomonas jessenii TaxID=77298 RepID=A0A370ST30_PSEJE|nr:hypothetical protein DEU51_1037 [Pseudomonas jessenii]
MTHGYGILGSYQANHRQILCEGGRAERQRPRALWLKGA